MENVTDQSDPVDDILGLLCDRRRRLVIYYLRGHAETEPISIETLAAAIAAVETGGQCPWRARDTATERRRRPATGGEDERNRAERLEISLVHTHLPKLHESGVVEFGRESRTVRATDPPEEFWDGIRGCQRFSAELTGTRVED